MTMYDTRVIVVAHAETTRRMCAKGSLQGSPYWVRETGSCQGVCNEYNESTMSPLPSDKSLNNDVVPRDEVFFDKNVQV